MLQLQKFFLSFVCFFVLLGFCSAQQYYITSSQLEEIEMTTKELEQTIAQQDEEMKKLCKELEESKKSLKKSKEINKWVIVISGSAIITSSLWLIYTK